jgi:CheY-like chemotaxis protein
MEEPKRIRILIVDDEKQFLINTAIVLNQRGFEVTGADSGFEAIEEIKKSPYDVAVLDVNMPGMDGNQALRELRKIRPDLEPWSRLSIACAKAPLTT